MSVFAPTLLSVTNASIRINTSTSKRGLDKLGWYTRVFFLFNEMLWHRLFLKERKNTHINYPALQLIYLHCKNEKQWKLQPITIKLYHSSILVRQALTWAQANASYCHHYPNCYFWPPLIFYWYNFWIWWFSFVFHKKLEF